MRPHSYVLALVWAYLQWAQIKAATTGQPNPNAHKRQFKLTLTKTWNQDAKTAVDSKYIATVVGSSKNNSALYVEVKLDSGKHILPVSKRYECVAGIKMASTREWNKVYFSHDYHYLSIPEEITFFYNDSGTFSFSGLYQSEHYYHERQFEAKYAYNTERPVGMKVQGYLKHGPQTGRKESFELEVKEFDVY